MEIKTQRLKNKRGKHILNWYSWIGYVAILWSVIYGIMNFYWLLGGRGYPFHQEEGTGVFSALFTYLPAQAGSIVLFVLCMLGVYFGLAMHQQWGRRVSPRFILFFSWGFAVFLLLFIPDYRLIAAMAYAFLLKFAFNWQMLNQIMCIFGALLWIFAAVSYQRKARNACRYCGRKDTEKPFALIRWGRWLTYFAAIAPIPYVITRFSWAMGIPLGVDPQILEDFTKMNPMATLTELVFGGLCIVGGLLTLGLIQKWGEVLPSWVPLIGGGKVPIQMAVIPGILVAIALTSAGFIFTVGFFVIVLQIVPTDGTILSEVTGTIGPMLSWMPWGVALGLATISYYYRRRSVCLYCMKGDNVNQEKLINKE